MARRGTRAPEYLLLSSFALNAVDTQGSTLIFEMRNQRSEDLLISYSDVDSGDHSSAAELRTFGQMLIVATVGSPDATLNGWALVHSNPAIQPPPKDNYLTSPVGSIVPFTVHYELRDDTWDANAFSRSLRYSSHGEFRFNEFSSVPEPSSCILLVIAAIHLMSDVRRFRS